MKLVEYLFFQDRLLSRTAADGVVRTDVSTKKLPPRLKSGDLIDVVHRNRLLVAEFLGSGSRAEFLNAAEAAGSILAIGTLANIGTSPGRIFREWEYKCQCDLTGESILSVDPAQILSRIIELGEQSSIALRLSDREKIKAVASIEWDIAFGPIHPFYDACGRSSRYYATLLLLIMGFPARIHRSREEYLEAAAAGRRSFIDYYGGLEGVELDIDIR